MALSEFRKELWHLRHGGIAQLKEHRLRQRAINIKPAPKSAPSDKSAGGKAVSFGSWPIPTPEAARHQVTAAVILDEFSDLALRFECNQIPVSPGGFREQLEGKKIDLLFVESAWHGNSDKWRFMVVGPKTPTSRLKELVSYCKERSIPTVFWNKEDPAHYHEAIATARLFDYVFTTDQTLLEQYRADLGHERVGVLPFAAQPSVHNPIRLSSGGKVPPRRDVAFAGMYFAHKFPERRAQMGMLLGAADEVSPRMSKGLDIFSRYLGGDPRYQFPTPLDKRVVGSLAYPQMLTAYRGYKAFLNVNSVVTSPSMCARRIFEISACGTPIVSAPSPAIDNFFTPDEVVQVGNSQEAGYALRALVGNEELRSRMTHLAQRRIWQEHTYAHRVNQVLQTIGLEGAQWHLPTVTPMISTNRPEQVAHVLYYLHAQVGVEMAPVILAHGFTPSRTEVARAKELGLDVTWLYAPATESLGQCYNRILQVAQGDWVAKMDDDDLYSPYYLLEQLAATDYSGADLVGKHAHYMYLASKDVTVLRFTPWEHRFTSFVSGPTIVGRRDLLQEVGFVDRTTGEDSALLKDVSASGGKIFSTSRFGFVQMRGSQKHTWAVSDFEVLANSRLSHYGRPNKTELP